MILLVEDNPRDEALTRRALKKSNIVNEVIVAPDVVEALDYLFGAGTHAGRDVTVRPQLTSSSEEEDMMKSYDLGANSYVRKPVDFEHFLEATKQLGLYWLVLNEAAPAE